MATKVIRHNPQFSRLVTIPIEQIAKWKLTETTTIEGTINDTELGRRSLKRWDEKNCWWIDLPETLCNKAQLETGDEVKLTIRLASEDLPVESSNFSKRTRPRKRTGPNSQRRNSGCSVKTSSPPRPQRRDANELPRF